ncbi:MAG: hypothetical protein JSU96_07355 [Acidobacteriota bacterium]|nr:MAG: hypothetical protein JSU96_07355 [Acidobacteriota bacterium]
MNLQYHSVRVAVLGLVLSGLVICSLQGVLLAETTYFPYFATGGGWQAVLLVVNDSNEDQTVRVLIGGAAGFETLDGLALDVEEGEAKFQIALESETIQRFVIGSSSTQLQTGFIVLESSDPITAALFFDARVDGKVRESVGIMPKRDLGNRWLVPIETGSERDTAVAILPEALSIEPSMLSDPNSYLPATIKLTLFNAEGVKVGSKNLELSQIYSRFITEIFELPARFLGYLEIEGVSQFSTPMVTALFFEWRGGGWELTAIPSLPAR